MGKLYSVVPEKKNHWNGQCFPRLFAIAKTNVFEEVSAFMKKLTIYEENKGQASKVGN